MLCSNCFGVHAENGKCPDCHYESSGTSRLQTALPVFSILNGRYQIGRVLGHGGFGITYVANDLMEEKIVAIKECMPEAYAYRNREMLCARSGHTRHFEGCLDYFHEEMSSLEQFIGNPGVVQYIDSFRENGTEYLVMEFINGVTLKYLCAKANSRLTLGNSLYILLLVGSALLEIHRHGVLHRDISPENIMIAADGSVKLIDFGASRKFLSGRKEFATFLKPGFAPPEQYHLHGNQGAWTDIYALAATFYTIVSGQPLIDANTRLERDTMKSLYDLDCGIDKDLSDIIKKAMMLDDQERYRSVTEFMDALSDYIPFANGIDEPLMRYVKQYRFTEHKRTLGGSSIVSGLAEPYVKVLNGRQMGTSQKIPDFGFITIGKEKKYVELALDDAETISRKHCLVGYDRSRNRFIVVDRSTNGTFYSNGMRMMLDAETYILPNEEFWILQDNNRVRIKVILE